MEAESLARIEARLERVEATLDRLAGWLDQVQPTVAMASDIADEWVAEKVGGDQVEARLQSLERALLQLSSPETLDAVTRVAALAPKLERTVELAASFDDTVGMAADIADEWVAENVGGDALEKRVSSGLDAVLALTEPRVMGALTRIAAQAPMLERVAGLAASFDDQVAMAVDIADEWVAETVGGDGLDERLSSFVGAALDAARPEVLEAVIGLAALAPKLQRSARIAADLDPFVFATAQALREPVEPVGMFGMLGAMGDPEIQRGLGRLLHLTRALARNESLLLESKNLES